MEGDRGRRMAPGDYAKYVTMLRTRIKERTHDADFPIYPDTKMERENGKTIFFSYCGVGKHWQKKRAKRGGEGNPTTNGGGGGGAATETRK